MGILSTADSRDHETLIATAFSNEASVSADSPDKNRMFQQLFARGNEAMNKQNWAYAVEMFMNCLKLDAENQQVRINLRISQRKMHNDNGSGARMAGMKLMGVRGRVKKLRGKEDWNAMDLAAEEGLAVNPWDGQLNADVGDACLGRGFLHVAAIAYKWAYESEQNNKEYIRKLAGTLESLADYKNAILFWEKIYKMDPLDSEARSKVTQLHAQSVMDRGGYEDADNTRDVKKQQTSEYDKFTSSPQSKQEVVGPGMSIEADLKREIRKSPENVAHYLKLAEYYKKEKRLEDARETLTQALQVSGGEPTVRENLEDVELEMLRNNYELARQAAASNPADEIAKENTLALLQELVKREIQVLNARVERYPRDSKLKVDLARRLVRVKQWDKAIPHLQQASGDQRHAAEVGLLLGKCFIGVNKKTLAISSLAKAVPHLSPQDQRAEFCEAHYLLGQLYEQAQDLTNAEKHYTEVIGADYNYRDALQRLEGVQGAAGGAG